MVRYVGTPTPTALVRAAVPEAVHGAGRVQAWVVGPGLDADVAGRGRRRPSSTWPARRSPGRSRSSSTPAASTCSTPRCSRQGGCRHPPHAARRRVRPPPRPGLGPGPRSPGSRSRPQPLAHARALAELTGATVLLKGATTIVVPPGDGATAWSQADAPPWLATAGAGDVLAGAARHAARRRPARRRRRRPRRPGPRRRRRPGQPGWPGAGARGGTRHPHRGRPPAGPRAPPGVLDSSGP